MVAPAGGSGSAVGTAAAHRGPDRPGGLPGWVPPKPPSRRTGSARCCGWSRTWSGSCDHAPPGW